jgi:hypothetical protein
LNIEKENITILIKIVQIRYCIVHAGHV